MHLHLKFESMQVNRLLWQCLPFYVQGQKVAFVGESGSGKSTIMALLERFYDPIAGAVLVNNQDLRRAKRKNKEIAFDILIGSDSNNGFIVIVTTNLPCKTFRDDVIASQHVPARHMEGIWISSPTASRLDMLARQGFVWMQICQGSWFRRPFLIFDRLNSSRL